MQVKNILILIGTIWPVVGVCLAVLIGLILTGWKRWVMLFVGPILFLLPCYIYAEEISYNGNMLFVALFGLVFAFGFLYYLVLVIVGIIAIVRNRREDKEE